MNDFEEKTINNEDKKKATYVALGKVEKFVNPISDNEIVEVTPSNETPLKLDERDGSLHSVTVAVSGFRWDFESPEGGVLDEDGNKYTTDEFLENLHVYAYQPFRIDKDYASFPYCEDLNYRIMTQRYTGNLGLYSGEYWFDSVSNIIIEIDLTKHYRKSKDRYIGVSPEYATTIQPSHFSIALITKRNVVKTKESEYYTPSEAAKELGVTVDCLRKWDVSGRLKPDLVTEGGHRRYLKERVDEIVNTRGSNILALANNLSEVIVNKVKSQYFTNGEMIMMDNYFTEDNDGEVVLFDKRQKIIQDGFAVIDTLINVTDKYADYRIDFKIMWRACCLKLSVGYLYDCQRVVDCFRKLVLTYDFLPLFEVYKSTYMSHDYWVYRIMMCEFVSEVKNNLEIMIEEEEDKQIEQSMEASKELAIEEFEKNEYDSLSVIHGRKIIHYYINNFTPVEDFNYLEIEVKDDDVFHALNEKFSKCRRRTLKNIRTRNNVPCIDDYLRDWFC